MLENFALDAESVRRGVIAGGFATQRGPDGGIYTGISQYPVPQWFDRLSELLEKKIVPRISCFRLNLAGELPHSWVHSDGICAQFATVLYLNPPQQCNGGTAFWKHKTLGLDRLPAAEELGAEGKDPEAFYAEMSTDWKNLPLWERIGFIAMKWNRLVTYPTCLFHSRYPFAGFGSGPSDGRLIWVCFYDLA